MYIYIYIYTHIYIYIYIYDIYTYIYIYIYSQSRQRFLMRQCRYVDAGKLCLSQCVTVYVAVCHVLGLVLSLLCRSLV